MWGERKDPKDILERFGRTKDPKDILERFGADEKIQKIS